MANSGGIIVPVSQEEVEDYEELLREHTNFTDIFGAELLENATTEQKRHLLMALQPPIELTDVLPPPNHDDVQVQVMAIGYMLLFLLGTCGNVAVLTTIYQMVRSRRANLDNTLIYMIVLSCVDFGVCLSLPFTVIDQILGFWMFGSTMCKLHAVLENFGKILSALIITAMSFDRFAGVCHSEKRVLRSRRIAFCILIGMAIYALVALCPLLYNFEAREVILFQKATGPNKVTRMRIEKCTMVDMVRWTFTLFTCFLFVLCYLVPLFLVTFFYTKLLSKLHHHARQFKSSQIRSQIPLMRISLYTLAVACFYFICWTPFWVATAFAVYLEYAGEQNGQVPPVFVYFMYFIHALPFTNSAVNWILYGALNGQLQQRVRHGTVHGGGGGGGGGAFTSVSVALGRTQLDFERSGALTNGHLSSANHHQHQQNNLLNNSNSSTTLLLATTNGKGNGGMATMATKSTNNTNTLATTSANAFGQFGSVGGVGGGCRHSSLIEAPSCAKRPSISPAQSIQPNSSSVRRICSLTLLAGAKDRRPSCPTTTTNGCADGGGGGGMELQQIAQQNDGTNKYRRRRCSKQAQNEGTELGMDGEEMVNGDGEYGINGVGNGNPFNEKNSQMKEKSPMNGPSPHHWNLINGTEKMMPNKGYNVNGEDEEEEEDGNEQRNGHYMGNEEEEDEEEESLLLHGSDSVNCLLRIDSQTSTYL